MSAFPSATLAQRHPASLSQGRWQDDARFTQWLQESWREQYADYLGERTARQLVDTLTRDGSLYCHHDPATLIASVADRMAGVAAFRPMGEAALVTLLEVVPPYRGRGIGRQLLAGLATGGRRLIAHVSIHRPRAKALYRSAGFTALERATVDHHGYALLFDVLVARDIGPDEPAASLGRASRLNR